MPSKRSGVIDLLKSFKFRITRLKDRFIVVVKPQQSGLTLLELMIGIGVMTVAIAIGLSQLQNVTAFFATITAEVSSRADVNQAEDLFKRYFQSKWRGGLFECLSTPRIGTDSYCVRSSDCASHVGASYLACRSIAIIRGDPADLTTNPDRVRMVTRCINSQATTQSALKFEDSVCNLSCAVGTYPATFFEITKADGSSTTLSYPGGTGGNIQRVIVSTSETRGFEMCLSKSAGSSSVTLDVQAYYLFSGTLRTIKKQVSVPEFTSTNPNIEFLP